MEIKTDFQIPLDEKALIRSQGPRFERLLSRPGIGISFHLMKEKIGSLAKPALAWIRVPVLGLRHDKLVLGNRDPREEKSTDIEIGGESVVKVMKEATELVVAVCTLGSMVDTAIEKYQQDKEMMNAVILDNIANWMVDQVRQSFLNWLRVYLEPEEKFLSVALGPGEAWDILDQKIIFKLMGEQTLKEQLGLELKPSMLMIPMKSLSFMVGLASEPFGIRNVSKCEFCLNKDKCRYPDAQHVQ